MSGLLIGAQCNMLSLIESVEDPDNLFKYLWSQLKAHNVPFLNYLFDRMAVPKKSLEIKNKFWMNVKPILELPVAERDMDRVGFQNPGLKT